MRGRWQSWKDGHSPAVFETIWALFGDFEFSVVDQAVAAHRVAYPDDYRPKLDAIKHEVFRVLDEQRAASGACGWSNAEEIELAACVDSYHLRGEHAPPLDEVIRMHMHREPPTAYERDKVGAKLKEWGARTPAEVRGWYAKNVRGYRPIEPGGRFTAMHAKAKEAKK